MKALINGSQMRDLEYLAHHTQVEFPRMLESDECEDLLMHSAKNIGCRLTYEINRQRIVGTWVPEHIKMKGSGLWVPNTKEFRIDGDFNNGSNQLSFVILSTNVGPNRKTYGKAEDLHFEFERPVYEYKECGLEKDLYLMGRLIKGMENYFSRKIKQH